MSIKSVRLRKERNRPPPDEPWIWLSREMLESEAWRLLPAAAKMVVFRIAIEHMHHAGTENGNLAVTYDDFVQYGVRRNSIRQAVEHAVQHGFTVITERGRRSIGADRWPTRYALTAWRLIVVTLPLLGEMAETQRVLVTKPPLATVAKRYWERTKTLLGKMNLGGRGNERRPLCQLFKFALQSLPVRLVLPE
jgi:hypothetical protein